jgi:thioredoxin-related protein
MLLAQQLSAAVWLKSLPAAQKKAKQKKALIFVDLFADWCGWCHKMEQEVFPSEVFQKVTENKILLRLNTEDGGEGANVSQRFGITSLPTFLLLTPEGTIAGMIRGYFPANEFAKTIADTEAHYKDFLKRVADEPSISKDFPKRLDLAKEFQTRYELAESEARFKKLIGEPGAPQKIRDEAYYELAHTQVLGKRYDDALKTIRKFGMVQTKGESYERARLLAGNIYVQQGNYQSAVNELRAFKVTFPNSQWVQNIDVVLPQLEQRLKRQ